jgi:hypothetical protein
MEKEGEGRTSGTLRETSGSPALGAGSNCRLRREEQSVQTEKKTDGKVDAQGVLHVLVNLHDRRLVAAAVAVVGRREDRNDVAIMRPVAEGRAEYQCNVEEGEGRERGRTSPP